MERFNFSAYLVPGIMEGGDIVKTLVRWAAGKRLTNRIPKLRLIRTLLINHFGSPGFPTDRSETVRGAYPDKLSISRPFGGFWPIFGRVDRYIVPLSTAVAAVTRLRPDRHTSILRYNSCR